MKKKKFHCFFKNLIRKLFKENKIVSIDFILFQNIFINLKVYKIIGTVINEITKMWHIDY